jgi:alpha-tubulin suppressor-like RCC1 family protein
LGDGTTHDRTAPVQESSKATTWASVTAGSNTACATKTDNTLWCWGNNDSGALGDDKAWSLTPVAASL